MVTKFRAFQLSSPGSLFSYYKELNSEKKYTLIEARLPKDGIEVLIEDLNYHGLSRINTLHITSWDDDHCEINSLIQIINKFRPDRIEVPSYDPTSNNGKACKRILFKYDDIHQKYILNATVFNKIYIDSLSTGISGETNDVVYHSLYNVENHNDMSQIRLFRSFGFNVLSLGDCESEQITDSLIFDKSFIGQEVDILILPHHGSDNSMLTGKFLDYCKPKLAVCASDYDNEYDHPRPSVTQMLYKRAIKLMTTKRGDIIIVQENNNSNVIAWNLISNNQDKEEPILFTTKRNSN